MTTTWRIRSSSPTRLCLSEHTLDVNVRRCDVGLFDFSEVEHYVRAMTADCEYLSGHIFFHHGDDSGFKAIRVDATRRPRNLAPESLAGSGEARDDPEARRAAKQQRATETS